MEQLKTQTARGRGTWGAKTYDIALATIRATRQDSEGRLEQTVTTFAVEFSDPKVGRRFFVSKQERSAFIAASFNDVTLEPVNEPAGVELPHPLAVAVDEPLSAVTFVTSYVQLSFGGGPPLNLYVWPRIRSGSAVHRRPDPGYADLLIGAKLNHVDEQLDYGLVLALEQSTRLTIPLDGTDLVGPEVAEFHPRAVGAWMVWRPGDEPIAWLKEPD